MRQAERVAGLARGDHGLGRAAGALGVGPLRVEPEPQRDADRVGPGAQQRDRAVDAAAHRDGDAARRAARRGRPARARSRARPRRASRRRPRPPRAASARASGRSSPSRVGARRSGRRRPQPDERPAPVARRVSDDLDHRGQASVPTRNGGTESPRSISSLPMRRGPCEPGQARWVPRLPSGAEASGRTTAPFHSVLVLH